MDEHVLWRYIKGHAKETPDSVAIISGDEKITYRDLDRLSDGLALELIDLGIMLDAGGAGGENENPQEKKGKPERSYLSILLHVVPLGPTTLASIS